MIPGEPHNDRTKQIPQPSIHPKRDTDMKHVLAFTILIFLLPSCSPETDLEFEPYQKIKIEPVCSSPITRDKDDRVYSGQIKSQTGLTKFQKTYGIDIDAPIDFARQMLIFGITDNLSSRAFQLLKQERMRFFTLDYAQTLTTYMPPPPPEGKKHSWIQVFVSPKIDGIAHIRVKNVVTNGLSKVYD